MPASSEKKNINNDEIDLLDLFRKFANTVKNWSNAIGRAILISTVFLLRMWLPLLLSIAAGLAVSYFFKTTTSSIYVSDLVLRTNTVEASDMLPYINRLNSYCAEKDRIALSEVLSLDQKTADNIIEINGYYIIDLNRDSIADYVDYTYNNATENLFDTTNTKMQDRLNITLKIKSPQELTSIRNGIIAFIEKDSLFKQRNRVRLNQNNELLSRLDYDIQQLDSLQKIKYFEETRKSQPAGGGSQMIFLQEQRTQLVYEDIYGLYEKKQLLETEKYLHGGVVTVLNDFTIPEKKDNGALFYSKQIIPLFFCITLLVLIILENKKKLRDVYKKYK